MILGKWLDLFLFLVDFGVVVLCGCFSVVCDQGIVLVFDVLTGMVVVVPSVCVFDNSSLCSVVVLLLNCVVIVNL